MVPITEEEKKLPYAKYFYRDLAPIPEEKIAVWKGPAAAPESATPFEERNRFLLEDGTALEAGFTVAPNGTGFVANATFMPGATPEMFDWWFGWHSVGSDLRYKLWDHDDHYHARADKPEYVLDPAVPNAEKTWGVDHDILEDIGFGPTEILLKFKKPSDLGFDMSLIGTPGCAAIVCGVGLGDAPAVMTHKAVVCEGGIWLKSHFWMGYGPDAQDGSKIVKLIPDGVQIPEDVPRSLYGHNIKEYSNLAAILPEIYAEEKDNWLD